MVSVFGPNRLRSLSTVKSSDFSVNLGFEEFVSFCSLPANIYLALCNMAIWLPCWNEKVDKEKKAPLLVSNFLCNPFFLEVSDCDVQPGEAI